MSFSHFPRRGYTIGLLTACVLAVALLSAACGRSESKVVAKGPENSGGGGARAGAGRGNNTETAAPVAVTTATAVTREVPSYFQATGSLIAEETSDVAPQVSGQVIATPVSVGAFVREGDVVV